MVSQINDQLKQELAKIDQTYNEDLLETEVDQREQATTLKANLDESFSEKVVNMHEHQRDLELQVTRLDEELISVQTEYNTLKGRYDDVIQKMDGIQVENQRLQNILNENPQPHSQATLLDVPRSDKDNTDALSISSNDIEIASELYVNIDYQRALEEDEDIKNDEQQQEYPMSEQLKILRETLDDAKKDVTNLREEKLRFERLSENLNMELNSLKSELQNQSVFEMSSRSFHHNQSQLKADAASTYKVLEASVYELLSASGYQLPPPEDDEAEEVAAMDESMLPSQYLHEGVADSDASENDGTLFFFIRGTFVEENYFFQFFSS